MGLVTIVAEARQIKRCLSTTAPAVRLCNVPRHREQVVQNTVNERHSNKGQMRTRAGEVLGEERRLRHDGVVDSSARCSRQRYRAPDDSAQR